MSSHTSRAQLTRYLDQFLDIDGIPDASANGLQVEGAGRVSKVAFAVDASVKTIAAARRARAEMLVVHHGLFWGKHSQIVGSMHRRISALIKANLSLYAAHLPLDCHAEVGNNVELARILGFQNEGRYGEYHGCLIGVVARPPKPLRRGDMLKLVNRSLGIEADMLPFGPEKVKCVGIISGGAAMMAETTRAAGCDTFLTGETAHAAHHLAKEVGINLIYGGHYATETVGLRALAAHLKKTLGVSTKFIPAPTGY